LVAFSVKLARCLNLIFGGSELVTTGLHAGTEWAVANENPL
jgi:hypothetical protein